DSGICGICGKDRHTHEWSEWKMKEIPGNGEPVIEERTCSGCGETETREVESVWQKYNLAEHYSDLPEKVCSGLNLWNVLPHDEYYFANGTNWAIYSDGTVTSVTIPISEGEKIYSTSFEDGGIRVAFFDAYGIAKTLTVDETKAEFDANGGYLVAPEGAIAVNVPMRSRIAENKLYLLDREHIFENGICTVCGEWKYSIGDINLDGEVNVKDAYYARLVAAKLIKPTDEQRLVGDVDLDGRITALDANIIRKFVAHLIEKLPVTG
ncbi:MAG: dockerin type I repeat-containing protein, partial [Oscillospiraceae bacterium]|nr:dockerin type I repeat-containing protein [Oscillospiraceae bacterium]